MSAEFRPKGLETWTYLLDESPIPVLSHTHQKLKAVVSGVNDWALSDVADVIVTDPIMTVHLLREASRVFEGKVAGTMTDVHHCVSLLGQDRVLGLIKQFKAMRGDPNDKNEVSYQAAIVQSFHAAEQIQCWHQVRKQPAVDKQVLAAKMVGVPTWCLWYFANKEMGMVDTLQKQERISQVDAERAVLGCTTQEIVQSLVKRWHFPDVIQDALDNNKLPSPQFLAKVARDGYQLKEPRIPNKDEHGDIVKTSAFIVALAHWLVREAALDWYSRQTNRVLAVLAAYLEVDLHQARCVAQQAAVSVSHRFAFPFVEMPAARLLLPPQPGFRRRIRLSQLDQAVEKLCEGKTLHEPTNSLHDEETKVFVPQAKSETKASEEITMPLRRVSGFVSEEKEKIFKHHLSLLLTNPEAYNSEHEVLRRSMEVLKDVTYLERVVLLLFDSKGRQLQGYSALGCEDPKPFKKLKVGLSPANFFTQLIRKPQSVWVHPERKCTISALVPGVFKQVAQADEFFAVSLCNHKQPVGVLYVDNGADSRKGLSEAEFKITRSVANATSKYLIQMGKRARNS